MDVNQMAQILDLQNRIHHLEFEMKFLKRKIKALSELVDVGDLTPVEDGDYPLDRSRE